MGSRKGRISFCKEVSFKTLTLVIVNNAAINIKVCISGFFGGWVFAKYPIVELPCDMVFLILIF